MCRQAAEGSQNRVKLTASAILAAGRSNAHIRTNNFGLDLAPRVVSLQTAGNMGDMWYLTYPLEFWANEHGPSEYTEAVGRYTQFSSFVHAFIYRSCCGVLLVDEQIERRA